MNELLHGGEPLEYDLRARLARCFQADLSAVRVHHGGIASQLAAALGVPAFCWRGHLFFAGGFYQPRHLWGQALLAHEVAHALQQRGRFPLRRPFLGAPGDTFENDADRAAAAFLQGCLYPVAPCPGAPEVLPFWPILLLIAAAVGLTAAGTARVLAGSSSELRRTAMHEGDYDYETAYGFIPIYGSYDQMMNGRTEMQQFFGTVFFVMDLTLIGGVGRAAIGMFRAGASRALAAAARGGGTAAMREALAQAKNQGFKIISRETAQQALNEAVRSGTKRYTVVAVSEGWLNHSAVYIWDNVAKKAYKLHGSVINVALRDSFLRDMGEMGLEEAQRKWSQQVAKRANRLSIYSVNEAEGALDWFGRMSKKPFFLQPFEAGSLWAPGCAGTQALVLEELGIGGMERAALNQPLGGLGRTFPILLDTDRMVSTVGSHLAIEGRDVFARQVLGTTIQGATGLGAYETLHYAAGAGRGSGMHIPIVLGGRPDTAFVESDAAPQPIGKADQPSDLSNLFRKRDARPSDAWDPKSGDPAELLRKFTQGQLKPEDLSPSNILGLKKPGANPFALGKPFPQPGEEDELQTFLDTPRSTPAWSHHAPRGVLLLNGRGYTAREVRLIPIDGGKGELEIDHVGDHYEMDPKLELHLRRMVEQQQK